MGQAALGYRGKAHWVDMSDYVAHFTKPGPGARRDYDNIMGILANRVIEARGAFGAARRILEVVETQRTVCFSEVPLGLLDRIVSQRGSVFGLAFRKSFITSQGGNPIWYVAKGTPAQQVLSSKIEAARAAGEFEDPIFALTPHIDFPGRYNNADYHFEWEREWRCVGHLRFQPQDVAFLFLAEEDHDAARSFFDDAERENTGPNYRCPFVDPRWDIPRMEAALAGLPAS